MTQIRFVASKQDRFERGKYCPTTYTTRLIVLDYSPLGNEVTINVYAVNGQIAQPIMQPKHGRLTADTGSVLKYTDTTNSSFKYEVETDSRNEIVRVSIFAVNPFTCEVTEYRYSI